MAKKDGMIKVLVVKPFGARVGEEIVQGLKGKEMMMPKDADWIKAGLVIPVGKDAETSTISAPENAAKHTGRGAGKDVVLPPANEPETVVEGEANTGPEPGAEGEQKPE